MIVLILNGTAESGKGTVVEFIEKQFNIHAVSYSSIDYVKDVAVEKFGWDGVKDTKGRNLLAGIKQLMIGYNDMPTKKVVLYMDEALIYSQDLFVVDIREPDEIEKLVEHCTQIEVCCITCRINNKRAETLTKEKGLSLTGDRLYGQYDYNLDIYNDGSLEELEKEVERVFTPIFGQENGHIIDSLRYRIKKDSASPKVGPDSHYNEEALPKKDHNGACCICGRAQMYLNHARMVDRCTYCGQPYSYRNY